MFTWYCRRLLAAVGLLMLLAACAAPIAQPQPFTPISPTELPTLPTTVPPTVTAPTALPTAMPLPTPDPVDATWVERDRSDYDGDGREDTLLYLPADVTPAPDAGFADAYYASQAMSVLAAVIVDPDGNELLRIHHITGISGSEPLKDFDSTDPPAAFLLALDPGSSYAIALQPLRADGTRHSPFIGLNYYADGFGIAPSGR
jgi:hypothetical protein